jgi:small-conductance mechanosensitive channel
VLQKSKKSGKIFRLLENALLNFIVLQGLQASIGLFSVYFVGYEWLISNFFSVLYVSIVTYIVLNLISIVSDWYLSRATAKELDEIDHRAVRLVQHIAQLVFLFLAITLILERFRVTQVSFRESLTALGIGGIIIGLAAQGTLADLIAGIALSIDRPFKIGDRIFIEKLGTWGDVTEMSWRSTRILTRDNRQVAVPNSVIGAELVTNYSQPDRMYRIETYAMVFYGPDIEYVRSLILEALEHEAWIMHEKPIEALLSEFMEFGVKFKIRCWIENFVDARILEDQLNTTIYKALISANIPTPCSDIRIQIADQENREIISRQDK